MARITLTTTAVELLTGPVSRGDRDDTATKTYFVTAPGGTGTALLQPGPTASGAPADWSDAARFNFGALGLNYPLEPGVSLYAKVESGTLDLDILPGGER